MSGCREERSQDGAETGRGCINQPHLGHELQLVNTSTRLQEAVLGLTAGMHDDEILIDDAAGRPGPC